MDHLKKIFVSLVMLGCFLTSFGQKLRTVDQWENLFIQDKGLNYDLDNTLSLSKDSWAFYKLAYSLDAHIAMFQATGKTVYLDRALELINNMKNGAIPSSQLPHSQFKDKYLAWANHSNEELKDDGLEYPLYESFCWRYVTSLLKILKGSPDIINNKKYANQYSDILSFTEANIFDKWTSRGAGYIYRSNAHMTSHWARISLDLWLITGKTKYKKIFQDFDISMRSQIQVNRKTFGAYTWDTQWNKSTPMARLAKISNSSLPVQIQDISHGNAIVGYIIEAYDAGIDFNKSDIDALIVTFNKVVWKDEGSSSMYIDGTGQGYGRFVDGFMKLGRFSLPLQRRLENYNFGPSSVYNRRNQFYAYGCLNARILLARKPVFPNL